MARRLIRKKVVAAETTSKKPATAKKVKAKVAK